MDAINSNILNQILYYAKGKPVMKATECNRQNALRVQAAMVKSFVASFVRYQKPHHVKLHYSVILKY